MNTIQWHTCPRCHQMIYVKQHRCPEGIQQYLDAELDAFVDFETDTFDQELEDFWNDPNTKFQQWLLTKDSNDSEERI